MAGGQLLYPWHQFTLAAIANSLGDRPVYFASAGSPSVAFGISQHVVRQGLAFQLRPENPAELASEGLIQNRDATPLGGLLGAWLDTERTRLLADSVFMHHSGIPDEWEYWPDRSTRGIPNYYAWMYQSLWQDPALRGDAEALAEIEARRKAWDDLGNSLDPPQPDSTES